MLHVLGRLLRFLNSSVTGGGDVYFAEHAKIILFVFDQQKQFTQVEMSLGKHGLFRVQGTLQFVGQSK